MPRLFLALDLKPDDRLIKEYEDRHRPGAVWPEIIADLVREGWLEMEIWRLENRLILTGVVSDDFPRGARDPAVQKIWERWQSEMDRYQERLSPDPDVKWVEMKRVFDLAEHLGIPLPEAPA
jgi:L-rhamnose mutarotase